MFPLSFFCGVMEHSARGKSFTENRQFALLFFGTLFGKLAPEKCILPFVLCGESFFPNGESSMHSFCSQCLGQGKVHFRIVLNRACCKYAKQAAEVMHFRLK